MARFVLLFLAFGFLQARAQDAASLFEAATPLNFSELPKRDLCWIKQGASTKDPDHYAVLMIRNTFLVPQLNALSTSLPRGPLLEGKSGSYEIMKKWLLGRLVAFESDSGYYSSWDVLKKDDIFTENYYIDHYLRDFLTQRRERYKTPDLKLREAKSLRAIYRQVDDMIVVRLGNILESQNPDVHYLVFKKNEYEECQK